MIGGFRWSISVAVVGIALLILSWPNYDTGTILWLACAAALIGCWPRPDEATSARTKGGEVSTIVAIVVGAGSVASLYLVATSLLPHVFAGSPDPNRGDMLPAIALAVEQFLSGGNPYRMYHIAGAQTGWDVPLSYGPLLWLPYVVPRLLHFDVRIFTLAGQLTIPAACSLAAVIDARRGHLARAVVVAALGIALAWQPQYREFFPLGHTQIYWPLLLGVALLVAAEKWTACCVAAGLLVAARTTMVSIVPILVMTLWVRGEFSWRRVALFLLAAIGPFIPFLLTAPQMVFYGLYGVYQNVVKGFVWPQTNWAFTTYGVTQWLLRSGLQRYLEGVQAALLLFTYALAYRGLRRGQSPLPWMVAALLVFCMTAVWPVLYIYFDVWGLAAAGLATVALTRAGAASRAALTSAALYGVAFAIVIVAGAHLRGATYEIDVGAPESAGMTGGGFGRDKSELDGDRTFVWVEGTTARVRLPRAGLIGGRVRVTLKPYGVEPRVRQTVAASLNDRAIGSASLSGGWQELVFDVPRSNWLYGFNVLTLQLGYAISAADLGVGSGTTAYSVAVDRVAVSAR